MRQVVGKRTLDLDAAAFDGHRSGRRLVVDLGTGDGKHVLAAARAQPDALVLGLDASPDAMRRTAARAADKPARGGTPNALYVWAAVERLPPELREVDEVHALMPWGSLLRALVRPDPQVLAAVAARCRPGAPFLLTLNLHAWRPPVPEVGDTAEPTPATASEGPLAAAYAAAGWAIERAWYPDGDEVAALGTSWTKRLGASREELAVLALGGTIVAQSGN